METYIEALLSVFSWSQLTREEKTIARVAWVGVGAMMTGVVIVIFVVVS